MRKTINVTRMRLDHGHGGVIHRELEPLRGDTIHAHALEVLKDLQKPDWEASGQNTRHALEALSLLVLELCKSR